MITYPIHFETTGNTKAGIQTKWNSCASNIDISCSVPKEFEGPGEAFSPEDLYLLAIQNCFIGTFKVFAEHSKLNYTNLQVISKLKVDKDEQSKPWMDTIHLQITVSGVSDERRLNLIVNKTLETGFILRSVKTKITSELVIQA